MVFVLDRGHPSPRRDAVVGNGAFGHLLQHSHWASVSSNSTHDVCSVELYSIYAANVLHGI